ncbi:hypothetical protein AA313_de0200214 [Arthrobotrys entomopaga]|nr:hypothetical protein AA313_de0200214 [Arthrobotrys entomopaga]
MCRIIRSSTTAFTQSWNVGQSICWLHLPSLSISVKLAPSSTLFKQLRLCLRVISAIRALVFAKFQLPFYRSLRQISNDRMGGKWVRTSPLCQFGTSLSSAMISIHPLLEAIEQGLASTIRPSRGSDFDSSLASLTEVFDPPS